LRHASPFPPPTPVRARVSRVFVWRTTSLVLILGLAVTYQVVALHDPPQPRDSGAFIIARAENWMTAALPAGARIGVDPAVFSEIAGTGSISFSVLASGWPDRHTETHVLSTPELREDAARDPAISAALESSQPIAVFGSGARRVEVRQVAIDGADALMRRWRQDVADRAVAGAGLLRNPRVRESLLSRAVLRHGGLDLRAVVLLALLAAKTDVGIIDLAPEPCEAVAGMPARHMRIAIPHADRSLTAVLAMLPASYQPSIVRVLSGGQRELEWPIAMAPVKSLG
jgi:hypothetical protein